MKYGNKITYVNGIKFDSVKEANRYCELLLLQRAKQVSGLELQKEFILIPTQYNEAGKVLEKAVKYKADFTYYEGGKLIVEDTKGCKTKEYIIKRKLMLYVHGIRIKES